MINGVYTWVPDTDGGLASYGQNRYNSDGLNGYGGMDNTGSSVIVSSTPSPVANVNSQKVLEGFNFSDVNKTADGSGNWTKGAEQFKDPGTTPPEQGWGDTFASWFTPQGDRGTSVGGNIMGAVGTGVGAVTGLSGLYYAKKNFDLQKDQQNYLKGREAQSDARRDQFAKNAANGASYNGVTSSVIK